MTYSPIILVCYKRVDTVQRCVAALQKCAESKFSDLIIVADAPAKKTDIERVNAVREFLPTITGFKSIEIILREKNLGVDYNIIHALKEMSARFEKFIIVEDDLVVGADFLRFLNLSLDLYATNPEILTVTGFSYLNKIPEDYPYDVYFAKRMCPWGWATWSDKIKDIDWEIKEKATFLKSTKVQALYNEWGSDRSPMLIKTLNGKIRAWDSRLDYHLFKGGYCTVYPIYTLVENIGFGRDDASNTLGYNRFKTDLKNSNFKITRFPDSIIYNKSISNSFISKNSLSERIYTRIMKSIGYKN